MLNTLYFKDRVAMQSIAERVNDSVIITTSDTKLPGPQIVYVNPAFCKKTGYAPYEIIGKSPRILQGPATEKKVLDRLRENLKNNEPFHGSTVNYRRNGTPYVVSWNIEKFWSDLYEDWFYISIQKEVTREYELDRLNHTIIDTLNEGIIGVDSKSNVLTMNPAAFRITGMNPDKAVHEHNWKDILDWDTDNANQTLVDTVEKVINTGKSINSIRDRLERCCHNGFVWVEVSVKPMFVSSDSRSGAVITLRDISDQKDFEKKLWAAANHDELTRAYSRRFGNEILERYTQESKEQGMPLSMLYFDIDNFKSFNDTHGHGVGDEVLKLVVNSVTSRIRKNDYLIRWGGEEFIVIIPHETSETTALIAESIRKQVEDIDINRDILGYTSKSPDNITISGGVSQYIPEENIDRWIERTDEALYEAKADGKNRISVVKVQV